MRSLSPRHVGAVLPFLLLASSGCSRAAAADASPKLEAPIRVTVVEAEERPTPRFTTLTGQLVGTRETRLAANAQGRVVETRVDRGSSVRAGDVLARLDVRAASLQAREARASLDALEARQSAARAECQRAATLLASGSIGQAEYERTRVACDVSPADRRAGEARAAMASIAVGDGLVRAPFAGQITQRFVATGEYVHPDTPVFAMVDLDALRLEVSVPEAIVGALREGAALSFEVPAHPARAFPATVRAVGASVRAASRDVVVDATLENRDRVLLPGMFATVTLPLTDAPSVIVPRSAIVERDGRSRVFVVARGRVEERLVERGASLGEVVPVYRGVRRGERVVRDPGPDVRNGRAVEGG